MRKGKFERASVRPLGAFLFSFPFLFWCGSVLGQANPQSLDEYFRRARELEQHEDYAGAERLYQDAARSYPHQPEILKRLGIVYQTELKFPESLDAFSKVLQGAPQYPEVNFYQGLSYFGLNQFDQAIKAFNKEIEANPKYRRARYYEALAFQSLNRNADALQQYEILVKEDPSDSRVLYQLIRFHKAATLKAINLLGNLDPDSEFMLVLKAEGYADQGKYPEAIQDYKQVLQKNPRFPGVHFALGEVYWKKVDYPAAEKELRLALVEDPNHPLANYYLGDILLKSQKADDAVPLLEIAVAANPQLPQAYFQLGKCYVAQGKLQEALKVLLKAAELDSSDKATHYQLAQLYAQLKQPDKSQYHMEVFRKLYEQERDKNFKRDQKALHKAEDSASN